MISESPENKIIINNRVIKNLNKHRWFVIIYCVEFYVVMERNYTRINNAEAAHSVIFSTCSAQVDIVWNQQEILCLIKTERNRNLNNASQSTNFGRHQPNKLRKGKQQAHIMFLGKYHVLTMKIPNAHRIREHFSKR